VNFMFAIVRFVGEENRIELCDVVPTSAEVPSSLIAPIGACGHLQSPTGLTHADPLPYKRH
jgi:hypothetical protein